MIKDFILTRLLRWIAAKLNGKKTIIGFVFLLLRSVLALMRFMWPELNATVPHQLDQITQDFGTAFMGMGIGHKGEKIITAVKDSGKSSQTSQTRITVTGPTGISGA